MLSLLCVCSGVVDLFFLFLFFFFKQKTAYELRISDWSSDVCSSDLLGPTGAAFRAVTERHGWAEITEIRRQCEDWQRDATKALATGRAGEAIHEIGRASCRERVCQYV